MNDQRASAKRSLNPRTRAPATARSHPPGSPRRPTAGVTSRPPMTRPSRARIRASGGGPWGGGGGGGAPAPRAGGPAPGAAGRGGGSPPRPPVREQHGRDRGRRRDDARGEPGRRRDRRVGLDRRIGARGQREALGRLG